MLQNLQQLPCCVLVSSALGGNCLSPPKSSQEDNLHHTGLKETLLQTQTHTHTHTYFVLLLPGPPQPPSTLGR